MEKINFALADWELKGHSHQIADTGDYDGYYEITNGKISLLTNDDDDEALQPIVDALNDSGCKFYQDDWFEFENKMLKEEISRLKFMIDNGLGVGRHEKRYFTDARNLVLVRTPTTIPTTHLKTLNNGCKDSRAVRNRS